MIDEEKYNKQLLKEIFNSNEKGSFIMSAEELDAVFKKALIIVQ